MPIGHGLGRRQSPNDDHIRKFPMTAVMPETIRTVERTLDLPTQYVSHYDQGSEGACVGFSLSWMMSILNRKKYDARRLYTQAQLIDEWDDTPPQEGTSVNAGCKILKDEGHWRLQKSRWWSRTRAILGLDEGIAAYRWARSADEVRTAIASNIPVTFGVNWYRNFSSPVYYEREWWIGRDANLGPIDGGHAICCYAASDERQAVRLVNTWGYDYPRVWISYDVVDRLIREGGEVVLITDR